LSAPVVSWFVIIALVGFFYQQKKEGTEDITSCAFALPFGKISKKIIISFRSKTARFNSQLDSLIFQRQLSRIRLHQRCPSKAFPQGKLAMQQDLIHPALFRLLIRLKVRTGTIGPLKNVFFVDAPLFH